MKARATFIELAPQERTENIRLGLLTLRRPGVHLKAGFGVLHDHSGRSSTSPTAQRLAALLRLDEVQFPTVAAGNWKERIPLTAHLRAFGHGSSILTSGNHASACPPVARLEPVAVPGGLHRPTIGVMIDLGVLDHTKTATGAVPNQTALVQATRL